MDYDTEGALIEALQVAQAIGESFARDWQASPLVPAVSVGLEVGWRHQPLLVFSLLLELAEDFDVEEYPEAEVERLRADLRSRMVGTPVDRGSWLVSAGTKVGASRR